MEKTNTLSFSELFEKGCVEYFGLSLMAVGTAWIFLALFESFSLFPLPFSIFPRVAAIVVYTVIGILLFACLSSYRTINSLSRKI